MIGLDRHRLIHLHNRNRTAGLDQCREIAFMLGRQMQNDHEGHPAVGTDTLEEAPECRHSACGCPDADNDEVTAVGFRPGMMAQSHLDLGLTGISALRQLTLMSYSAPPFLPARVPISRPQISRSPVAALSLRPQVWRDEKSRTTAWKSGEQSRPLRRSLSHTH